MNKQISMITVKAPDLCYFPTSAKELKRLILAFSIPCNVVKYLGKYDVVYSNRESVQTPAKRISDLTLKQWYQLLIKNLPSGLEQGEQGILYTDLITKVNKSII